MRFSEETNSFYLLPATWIAEFNIRKLTSHYYESFCTRSWTASWSHYTNSDPETVCSTQFLKTPVTKIWENKWLKTIHTLIIDTAHTSSSLTRIVIRTSRTTEWMSVNAFNRRLEDFAQDAYDRFFFCYFCWNSDLLCLSSSGGVAAGGYMLEQVQLISGAKARRKVQKP